jgi:4-hydroxybenzoate polyprenyltransferase
MQRTRATLRLIRPYSSGLAVLSVLLPVFARTRDFAISLERALPLMLGAMCTYILNDLDDLEKDKVNHPDRPLPSGQVTTSFVVILYYACLALALLTTHIYVGRNESAFLYYVGFSACISYRYVVEYLPAFKSLYVAATTTIPVLILMTYYPTEASSLRLVAIAIFLSMLGRELCKDIPDRPGDPGSFLKKIDPATVARVAFAVQGSAVIILCLQIRGPISGVCLITMALALMTSYVYWFHLNRQAIALALMKAVAFFGLYFLL